jgi:release factor glutamine methyltransferase
VEFSIEALNVMQQNKQNINSKVSLIHANLLNNDCWDLIPNDFFDVLVSNPPYITIDERKSMSDSVLNFEPELALFVPNEDPLLFYRVLIHKGYAKLKKGGKFFFELNPLFVEGVIELMCIANLVNITVKKDLQGKERMLMGQKL